MTSLVPGRNKQDSQGQRSQGQARVFAMTRQEAAEAPHMITGKVFLFDVEAYALIDPGSTHSYISSNIASCLHIEPGILNEELSVRPIWENLQWSGQYIEIVQ